jgi:hypothetical protein
MRKLGKESSAKSRDFAEVSKWMLSRHLPHYRSGHRADGVLGIDYFN